MIFRDRAITAIYRNSKRIYYSWIKTLSSQPEVNMNIVRKHLRRYAVQYAKLEWDENCRGSLSGAIIVPSFFIIAGGFLLRAVNEIGYVPLTKESHISSVAITYAGLGAVVGLLLSMILLEVLIHHRFSGVISSVILALIGIMLGAIASVMLSRGSTHFWPLISHFGPDNVRDYLAIGILSAAETIATAGLFLVGGLFFVVSRVITPLRIRHPDTVIIGILVDLLYELKLRPSRFSDIDFKRRVCGKIENAASYLQDALPQAAGISDTTLDQALREQLGASARHLQEVQMWVILANDKTFDEVCDVITHYIYAVALGQYNLLPVSNSIEPKSSKVRRSIILIRTFIVALIPIGCIVAVRYAGFSLSPQFTGWAVVVAITWAAITMVSTLDPLYKTRLTDVRDLISSIRGRDD